MHYEIDFAIPQNYDKLFNLFHAHAFDMNFYRNHRKKIKTDNMENKKKKAELHIDLGTTLLFLVLLYIVILIISFFSKSHVYSYQVKEGSLAVTKTYTGIALREETIHQSAAPGYIEYFAREGEHIGFGELIYAIDESGTMDQLLSVQSGGDNTLSNSDLSEMKAEIVNFSSVFKNAQFDRIYDFMYDMNGAILKIANKNLLETISDVNNRSYADVIQLVTATEPGYVVYNIDGYEGLTPENITADSFDETAYEKQQLLSNSLVDRGSFVYKSITSEEWHMIIQLDEERAEELKDEGYVSIRFLENQRKVSAKIEVIQNEDGFYGVLTFNNSMVTFCTSRFIEIELLSNEEKGLKIPVSSIVHKQFYLVPSAYIIEQLEDNEVKLLRKCFQEDGSVSREEIIIETYSFKDDMYYVDDTQLKPGDYLIKENSQEEYPVSTKGELVGVYNMNKGYADFREINILYQNEEYAIIQPNTTYGLNVYDYIVLDSSTIEENDFVFD